MALLIHELQKSVARSKDVNWGVCGGMAWVLGTLTAGLALVPIVPLPSKSVSKVAWSWESPEGLLKILVQSLFLVDSDSVDLVLNLGNSF
jgi:hypothetical protein